MTDLQKEISELKDFISELKADRAVTKEKERREAWTKYVSLTVVVVAVIAAIATQWGGKYSSRTQMSQARASDMWSFYQAKSIKQHLDEVMLAEMAGGSNAGEQAATPMIRKLRENLARYDKEKEEIKAKAEGLEKLRDEASRRSGKMALAVSYFTVAIATASICLVTKKKPLWFLAMALSGVAIAQMLLAWL